MNVAVFSALAFSAIIYVWLGWRQRSEIRSLSDILPLRRNSRATVRSSSEFSASTTATTVSLATVVLAYFELAPYLGSWLFWTIVTTVAGILVVWALSSRIAAELATFAPHIPTIHEFLGSKYQNSRIRFVSAAFTSIGFLAAMAVELTVGSRFLSSFFPNIDPTIVVVAMSAVGLTYTMLGGFRAVVVTDRLQMALIWCFGITLSLVIGYALSEPGTYKNTVTFVADLSYRDGLIGFLLGIFIINVPTYVADMSIWQRIGATEDQRILKASLRRSALTVAAVWTLICLLALAASVALKSSGTGNPLIDLVQHIPSIIGSSSLAFFAVFLIALGLLGAMLSTASTQMIAFAHAAHEDVIPRAATEPERDVTPWRFAVILLVASGIAVFAVEALNRLGLSIADLVFGVYGAQIGIVPALFAALFIQKEHLVKLGGWVMLGIGGGFISGWSSAIGGRAIENSQIVFLSPVISLGVSTTFVLIGLLVHRSKR